MTRAQERVLIRTALDVYRMELAKQVQELNSQWARERHDEVLKLISKHKAGYRLSDKEE